MIRFFLVACAVAIATPLVFAQQIPPPENPADAPPKLPPQGPVQAVPQNAAQNQAAAPIAKRNAGKPVGKPPEYFAARRKAQNDRKAAAIERMRQFQAVRAVEEQKLYQDWHERYLADTPVRVEYYRALAAAYQSQPAFPRYSTPYFYAAGPPLVLPIVYGPVVYTPIYQPPIYGTFFSVGW